MYTVEDMVYCDVQNISTILFCNCQDPCMLAGRVLSSLSHYVWVDNIYDDCVELFAIISPRAMAYEWAMTTALVVIGNTV